ncbi:MAG TPA: peptidase S41 [Parabacteroides sp.]|nr:peptidase S41 [Parabacteroides sp.]
MIKQLWIVFSGLFLLFSCQDTDEYTVNPRENFEALWKILDENYCFFDYKAIDWDEVHSRYAVQIQDSMNQFELFDLMAKMLSELKDGHTNLYSSFNVARYWDWYKDYPPNFYEELNDAYLGKDYKIAGGMEYKKIANDRIGYVRYSSFSSTLGESNLDYMFYHFKECQALVIDIRNNGGGSLANSERFASRFIQEKTNVGYIMHKTGKGHNDFSEPYPIVLEPTERIRWLRPVVVLTNRHCYSAANDFVMKMRMFPHVTIMGDKTGGGSGFPFTSELPNGWSVRFSACPMLDNEKQLTEFGIEPDIPVSITESDLLGGKDTIIEEAILYLLRTTEK